MDDSDIASVDLNLLVVVDAVLQERSATLAASRLHLTQSAVSGALRRARAVFGDALVTRTGRGFVLTPRAEALAPRLQAILEDVRGLLGPDATFRPDTTTRRFTIACADFVAWAVLPVLLPRFEARLPRARLRTVNLDQVVSTGLGHADVDVVIGAPPVLPAGCESEVLFEDPLVAMVRADHPMVRRRLELRTYARLPHAELALFGEPEDRVDRALAARGLCRHVQVTVPQIGALPFLVVGSDRVATVVRSAARRMAELFPLRLLEPPVELAPLVVQQVWHRRRSDDPGSRIFRELVRAAAQTLVRPDARRGRRSR